MRFAQIRAGWMLRRRKRPDLQGPLARLREELHHAFPLYGRIPRVSRSCARKRGQKSAAEVGWPIRIGAASGTFCPSESVARKSKDCFLRSTPFSSTHEVSITAPHGLRT